MKKNYMIDILKLFFAVCIVGLHTGLFLKYKYGFYLHSVIFRLGVPFFFITSGYFLGKGINSNNRKEIIKKFIFKLLPTYLVLGGLYSILGIIRYDSFSIYNILNNLWYLFTGRCFSIMWYVGALITSAIVLLHMDTKRKLEISIIIALVLYFIGLSFNTYAFVLKNTQFNQVLLFLADKFDNNSNFLFCGYYYVSLGFYLSRYVKDNLQKKIPLKILFIFVMFILLLFETKIVRSKLALINNYEYYISHVVLVPLIFNIALLIKGNINTVFIRQLSKYMYYFHYLVIYVFVFLNKYKNNTIINDGERLFIYTLIITIIISILYIFSKKVVKEKMSIK